MSRDHLRWAGTLERELPRGPWATLRRMAYTVDLQGKFYGALSTLMGPDSERTVRDHLHILRCRGLITRVGRAGENGDGDGRSYVYQLMLGARPTPETPDEIESRHRSRAMRLERRRLAILREAARLAGVPVFPAQVPAETTTISAEVSATSAGIEPDSGANYRQTSPVNPPPHHITNNKTNQNQNRQQARDAARDAFRRLYNRIRLGREPDEVWEAVEAAVGGTVAPVVAILRRQIAQGKVRAHEFVPGPVSYLTGKLWLGYEEEDRKSVV